MISPMTSVMKRLGPRGRLRGAATVVAGPGGAGGAGGSSDVTMGVTLVDAFQSTARSGSVPAWQGRPCWRCR